MPKNRQVQLPRCGTIARRVADTLLAKAKKRTWWFPENKQESRALIYLRGRGWPLEDFNPEGVSGRNTYRLDPERMSRLEVVGK